jgi:hypothetical protein
MLTPKFELTQTETKVCIIIFAPYTNISETEIYVEKNDFRFFSPPYYLRYVEYIQNIVIFHISDVLYFMNLYSVWTVLWNLKCHM